MLYTVYKVLNLLTGEFYIGVHKTVDPNDDYLGSGKIIRAQVAQHGRANFSKEILATFQKRRDAYDMERAVVEPLLGTPGFLNLHPGGQGGFGYVNRPHGAGDIGRSRAKERGAHLVASRCCREKFERDAGFREAMRATSARNLLVGRARKQYLEASKRGTEVWTGCKHTPETRKRIAEGIKGAANGAFGTVWLHHPDTGDNKRVSSVDVPTLEAQGWVRGRRLRRPS